MENSKLIISEAQENDAYVENLELAFAVQSLPSPQKAEVLAAIKSHTVDSLLNKLNGH